MTFQKIYDKLLSEGYFSCKVISVSLDEENIIGIKITCSTFFMSKQLL